MLRYTFGHFRKEVAFFINVLLNTVQLNNRYKLAIDKNCSDERGLNPESDYEKNFTVGKRDSASPGHDYWHINQPKASTKETLTIKLYESLDYLLLKNAISITDKNGNSIPGSFEPTANETILSI